MEDVESLYRAMLGRIYTNKLIADVDRLSIIHDGTSSCFALATAVATAAWEKIDAIYTTPVEVDKGLVLLSPKSEVDTAVEVVKKIKKFIALHTPVFYTLIELSEAPHLFKNKEVRYAVRKSPGEIVFYRVNVIDNEVKPTPYDKWILSNREIEVVKKFEQLKKIA
ncbi:MAG: hypothetical protein QXK71_05560 [Pyrobaculum sp.]